MSALPAGLWHEVAGEAARAPSVHNVQPARWRFLADGEVVLLRDLRRALPVADPTGHDVLLSLGAAWEGLALALARRGFELSAPEPCAPVEEEHLVPVARGRVRADGPADPLAGMLLLRRAYRGRFAPASAAEVAELVARFAAAPDVTLLTDAARIAAVARRHDEASWGFLRRRGYEAELYRWLRFRKGSPAWRRDGLTADCMALSLPERWAAALLLYPRVFALLKALGLGPALVAEAPAIASAGALLLFAAPREAEPFAVGRRFHRLWLELTAAGWHACPLSALADDPAASAELAGAAGLPPGQRLVNVLRVGKAPEGRVAESPRLPVDELLV